MEDVDVKKVDALWAKHNPDKNKSLQFEDALLVVKDYFEGTDIKTDDAEILRIIGLVDYNGDGMVNKQEMEAAIVMIL